MTFRELTLSIGYNSENTDVVNEFFVPVLKVAKSYKRVSAYYSSNSLKLISEGLSSMINNDGDMKLLVSYVVSEEDFNAIISAKKQPEEILKSMKIGDEVNLSELMKDKNVSALGYLIATNRLDIKFVICREGKGIFHLKFGIFTDEIGDKISFSGSINETYEGLSNNIEEFLVFRSWIADERKYVDAHSTTFDNYWNEKINRKEYLIVDMPESFKTTIIKMYNQSENKFKTHVEPLPLLWKHQQTAIDKWKSNGYLGIVEMATGTGKTNVAMEAIKQMTKLHSDNLLVVIGCPTKVLVSQWEKNVRKYISNFDIITISQNETKDNIYRAIIHSQTNHVIIGTYISLAKTWFTNIVIEKYNGNILFISDEVHWLGAENLSKALLDKYKYRLGLTATPVRYFDPIGTQRLLNYFKDTVFRYTLKEAISNGRLTPYDYFMFFAYLTEEETQEYQKLTKRFGRKLAMGKKTKEDEDSLLIILAERAKIVKKAFNKIIVFRHILQQLHNEDKLTSLLIYVEDEDHLETYLDILDEFDIEYRKIEGSTKDEDRTLILDDLASNKIDCVIAMKVLDEGVDIPNAVRAIFVSSSGNSKQFIQRRGRILRNAKGKKLAEVYDICVLLEIENQEDEEFKKMEEKVTTAEFRRLAIFSVSAHNYLACYKQLEGIGKTLNIDVFSIINDVKKYA